MFHLQAVRIEQLAYHLQSHRLSLGHKEPNSYRS